MCGGYRVDLSDGKVAAKLELGVSVTFQEFV